MRKYLFLTFAAVSVLLLTDVQAQDKKDDKAFKREAFIAKRNAYITAETGLTPEEAAKFIPLFNEFKEKMFEAGRGCRRYSKQVHKMKNPTETDYTKVVDECVGVRMKEAQIEKEYYSKFKEILSPEKLYKFRCAEANFARSFMRGEGKEKEKKH